MNSNAHMAIHVSSRGEKVVTQPRDTWGRFMSPVNAKQTYTTSFHVTFNGKAVRLKEVKK